ncbi:uncharacterized protein BX664DRAFT_387233 [Halteromyces radiatus]|uniref:uncharacterized protein n=1 Tax=Halteromyces radiatus TaxID=101107 RepID=UPI002220DD4D|nr:uncharacterized protein BX664DRAFT_387233 [Halteromyces radiatus]KAI8084500.1 hypothetical protein BX664DRAFT_387233 [Halteromyces radiatus]
MARSTKEDTPEDDNKLITVFYKEDTNATPTSNKHRLHWSKYAIPSDIQPHPIVSKLREMEQASDCCVSEIPMKLTLNENDAIEIVRKENVFGEEVTESEMDIIQQRVALQQRQFAEYEKREKVRKFQKVFAIYDYLTVEEMDEMLQDCKNDEDEIIVRLTQPGYLLEIRRKIATKHAPEVESSQNKMTEEQLEAYKQLLKKRSATLKKTTNDSAKKQYRLGGRLALDDALKQVQENGVDPDKAFEGWSAARIRAYQMIEQNPNSYYYRFNAPGEIQQKGQWSPHERELFFKRLEEVGANGQWGYFAMTIPGRVGYQCSNFYRLLVETGQVDDPNYVLDEKGKAHYLFDKKNANGTIEKTFRTHNKHAITDRGSSSASPPSSSSTAVTATRRRRAPVSDKGTVKKRKRRSRGWNSDDDDDDEEDDFEDYNDNSGTYTTSTRTRASTRRTRSRFATPQEETDQEDTSNGPDYAESEQEEPLDANPLPGFIDPITLDEVEKPAISKYGHVMGYDSWVRCLTNWEGKKNICPLTKKPLTKRDLVVLTLENIEEYRDRILNI